MASLGDLIIRIGATTDDLTSSLRSVIDQVEDTASKVESRLQSIGDVGRRLATLGAEMTAGITLPIEEIGRRSLETAAQFEQTQIAFTTFLGSSAAAQGMLAQLYSFAATTPFEVPGVLQGGRTLLAMGFNAKDVIPIMRTLGDTASGLGVGQAGLERFVFHLGQIKALGHIDGMILREMGQNGVAAAQMIADYMGKTVPQITKMVERKDPSLDSTTVINALLAGMNSQFGGAMKDQMQSLAGQWSNFKDQITLTMVDIGNVMLPLGKQLLAWGSDFLGMVKELAHGFANLPAPVQAAIGAMIGLAAAIGPALVAVGGFMMSLPGLVAAFGPIATWSAGAVLPFLGWAAAIAVVIAALTALGMWVAQHWDGVKAAVAQAWDGISEIWDSTLGGAMRKAITVMQVGTSEIASSWHLLDGVLGGIFESIAAKAKSMLEVVADHVSRSMMMMRAAWAATFGGGVSEGVDKIASAGQTFQATDAAAKKTHDATKRREQAEATLHLDSEAYKISGDDTERAKNKVEEYKKAVAELEQQFKDHLETAEKVKKAHVALGVAERELAQAIKMKNAVHDAGKPAKLDRNALGGISGEEAHQEALLNMRRAAVAQEYKESQPTGTDKANMSPETIADMEVQAAARRRVELQAIAGDELKITLAAIDKKLQLYKGDESGYQALVESKKKAQDKFVAEFQKAGNEEKDVTKKANEQIEAENRRHQAEEYRAMKAHAEAMAQVQASIRQGALQHADAERSMAEKQAEMRLELGEITKKRFLAIKQEEIDKAFQMDMEALADEQRVLIQMQNAALAEVPAGKEYDYRRQGINDQFGEKQVGLFNRRQGVVDRHQSDTQGVRNEGKLDQYNAIFKPIQTSFASGLKSMIEGTKTFKQAWMEMSRGILDSWIGSMSNMVSKHATALLQMAAKWVAHHVLKLGVHVATNQAQVASDAAAAAQTNSINQAQHMKDILRDAKAAALKVWKWTADIPFVGAFLAPVAAAATFAAAMAFGSVSAARGAVLPNEPTIGLLHPKEMVLPSHLSEGIQGAINNGTFASGNQLSPAGNSLNTSVLQQIATNTLNTAQALGYKSGIAGNNLATQDNKPGSPLEGFSQGLVGQIFGLFGQSNPQLQQMNMVQLLRVIADNTSNLKRGFGGGGILGGILPFFEDGGVSEKDGLAYLHAKEMTLPAHLSTGLQRMITYSGGARMFSGSGSGGGDTNHHWGGVQITLHNSAKQPLTPDHVFNALQSAVRGRNLKMA